MFPPNLEKADSHDFLIFSFSRGSGFQHHLIFYLFDSAPFFLSYSQVTNVILLPI